MLSLMSYKNYSISINYKLIAVRDTRSDALEYIKNNHLEHAEIKTNVYNRIEKHDHADN
jgi:hypothetical protein